MSDSDDPVVDVVDLSAVLNSEEVPQIESSSEITVEEVPVEETVAPVEETVAPSAPTTQEVVENVQEILSSTDTSGSVNELENRVKVLEERLEKLISHIKSGNSMPSDYVI